MALSASTKANIDNLKGIIEGMQREIASLNNTIKNNNSKTGSKSAGESAKQRKKYLQERIKDHRAAIASMRKNG